jgi:hypothetical protein
MDAVSALPLLSRFRGLRRNGRGRRVLIPVGELQRVAQKNRGASNPKPEVTFGGKSGGRDE